MGTPRQGPHTFPPQTTATDVTRATRSKALIASSILSNLPFFPRQGSAVGEKEIVTAKFHVDYSRRPWVSWARPNWSNFTCT